MKFVINLIVLVSSVSILTEAITSQQYINVINADKNPPEKICGGVLVDPLWALSSKSCVESLFKSSQNVIITAGHSADKAADQIIKVTVVPVNKEVKKESIVALRLQRPITKNSMVSCAKLPMVGFYFCKNPKSVAFQPKMISNNETSSRDIKKKKITLIFHGIIIIEEETPCCATCREKCRSAASIDAEVYPSYDDDDDGMRQQGDPYSTKRSGPKIIKVKSKKQECQSSRGWPLMCNDRLVGIEIKCQPVDTNETESEYLNVYHFIKDIARIVYHKELSNQTESIIAPSIAPPVVRAPERTTATSGATSNGRVWKEVILLTVVTIFNRMY